MSNYVIGDIQGCFTELMALIKKINFNPHYDRLWFTGDLVNRGPQSLDVLRWIKSLESPIIVLGNHDLHLLAVQSGKSQLRSDDTLQDILSAPDCQELCDWVRQQPLIYEDKSLGYVLVHAGIPPQWTLDQAIKYAEEVSSALKANNYQDFLAHLYGDTPNQWSDDLTGWSRLRLITNYLTRLRFCDPQGTIELKNKGEAHSMNDPQFLPWFQIPARLTKNCNILFGHWAALCGVTDEPHAFALDTGCVWGNSLTAMRLEDKARFSVTCRFS